MWRNRAWVELDGSLEEEGGQQRLREIAETETCHVACDDTCWRTERGRNDIGFGGERMLLATEPHLAQLEPCPGVVGVDVNHADSPCECQIQVPQPQSLLRSTLHHRMEILQVEQLLGWVRRDHRKGVVLGQIHHADDLGAITEALRNEGGGPVKATQQEPAREIAALRDD